MTDNNIYNERQEYWRNISISQLSFANNLFITISAGYFALIFDERKFTEVKFILGGSVDWPKALYVLTIFFVLLSIITGVFVVIARLYDFKISRHIALTRKRFFKKYKKGIKDKESLNVSLFDRLQTIISVIFIKIKYISPKEIDNFYNDKETFRKKFYHLCRQSEILGTATWRWTKIQISLALFSLLTFMLQFKI